MLSLCDRKMMMWMTALVLLLHLMSTLCQQSGPGPQKWRLCYVCKGRFPDRECELYPKYVTRGPGRTNCTQDFCTSYVRYTPKRYLMRFGDEGDKPTTSRPLTPNDFEVTSIVRECEDFPRKNMCTVDSDQMGVTCYSTCVTDFCNSVTPRPTWDDFKRPRDPEATTVPFPDVFGDEEEERASFGPFIRPPGFPSPGRDGGEEGDNEIDERRRPPFGQFPPFAGLLRPGEYPKPDGRDREFQNSRPPQDFEDNRGPPFRRTGPRDDFKNGPRGNELERTIDPGKIEEHELPKPEDIENELKPKQTPNVMKDKPKPTTPTSPRSRRPTARRGRINKDQSKTGEAGETSKSQGDKSSSGSVTTHISEPVLITIAAIMYLIK